MEANVPTIRRSGAGILRLAAAATIVAVAAIEADAAIYFTDTFGQMSINRANNDGTNVDLFFVSDGYAPRGLAVDDTYIYWASGGQAIGRAKLDGSEITPRFVETGGAFPGAVHVNASHLYWTNASNGTIGRANIDGSAPNPSFITGVGIPNGIAGDSTYIYWVNRQAGTIGRATLDGVTVEHSFITGLNQPVGVAVNATHLYWTSNTPNNIGRASIDGSSPQADFLTGISQPNYLTLDDTYLYWAAIGTGHVARALLDGSQLNNTYLYGGGSVQGIAVNDLEVPSTAVVCPNLPGDCEELGGDGQISFVGGDKPKTKVSFKKVTITNADLGIPQLINGTSFRLCIYVDDALVSEAGATAGDPNFKLKPGKILTYKNKEAAGDLSAIKMKVGAGKGSASATAPESPPLPLLLTTSLTAELRSSGGHCFAKTWTTDQVIKTSEKKFIAK